MRVHALAKIVPDNHIWASAASAANYRFSGRLPVGAGTDVPDLDN